MHFSAASSSLMTLKRNIHTLWPAVHDSVRISWLTSEHSRNNLYISLRTVKKANLRLTVIIRLSVLPMFVCLFVCWSLTSLCHSNGHIETMPARECSTYVIFMFILYYVMPSRPSFPRIITYYIFVSVCWLFTCYYVCIIMCYMC